MRRKRQEKSRKAYIQLLSPGFQLCSDRNSKNREGLDKVMASCLALNIPWPSLALPPCVTVVTWPLRNWVRGEWSTASGVSVTRIQALGEPVSGLWGVVGPFTVSPEQGLTCPSPHTYAPQNFLRRHIFPVSDNHTMPQDRTTVMIPFLLWSDLADRAERKEEESTLKLI